MNAGVPCWARRALLGPQQEATSIAWPRHRDYVGVRAASRESSWKLRLRRRRLRHPTAGMAEAVQMLAREEGILLDPVYSGKAMAGLIDLIRKARSGPARRRVLHTGGASGFRLTGSWNNRCKHDQRDISQPGKCDAGLVETLWYARIRWRAPAQPLDREGGISITSI